MRCWITGIGVSGPGLPDWPSARTALGPAGAYVPRAYQPSGRSPLEGPERRRATAVTRLALEAAMEAAGPDRGRWDIPTVFASSGGEVDTCDLIFDQLARPERSVSPTQFHNSVHNAASGYWGIASGSHQPSTSLACFDDTVAAALLESMAMLAGGHEELLMVAYDCPPPFPIGPFRPLLAPFAVAFRLAARDCSEALACLDVSSSPRGHERPTVMPVPELETLRVGNPAARALPLLAAIAGTGDATIRLAGSDSAFIFVRVLR
ncbi:MAG: beta-ketoacyl synthase chain length factor [Methylotetracoccus sp.]